MWGELLQIAAWIIDQSEYQRQRWSCMGSLCGDISMDRTSELGKTKGRSRFWRTVEDWQEKSEAELPAFLFLAQRFVAKRRAANCCSPSTTGKLVPLFSVFSRAVLPPPGPARLDAGRRDGKRHRAAALTFSRIAQGADRRLPLGAAAPALTGVSLFILKSSSATLARSCITSFSPGRRPQNLLLPGSIP